MTLIVISGLTACTEPPRSRVTLDVYRYVAQYDCYVPCETNSEVDEGFAAPPGAECSQTASCVFEAGRDRARIVVDFGPVSFSTDESLPDVEVQTLVNGVDHGAPRKFESRRASGDRVFAATDFHVPVATAGVLHFDVDVADGYGDESEEFGLAEPVINVEFLDCGSCDTNGETCQLPSSGGSTPVLVDAPRGLPNDQLQLVTTLDDIVQPDRITVDVPSGTHGPIAVDMKIPDGPGQRWGLRAVSGEHVSRGCREVTLTPRAPATLAAAATFEEALDADNGSFPRRLALEPNPACRRVTLASRSSQVSTRHNAEFDTNVGNLDEGGTSATVAFTPRDEDDAFQATTQLVLPASAVPDSTIELSVEVDDFGTVNRVWHLEDLPVGGGELFGPPSPQTLTTVGTVAQSLTGFLRPPQSLRLGFAPPGFATPQFSPGTMVSLVVEVLEVYDVDLECGPPIPPDHVHCDRDGALTGPTGPQGGCMLTPDRVPVRSDGGFTANLSGNLCFAGRVAVSIYAAEVDVDPDVCVGEQLPEPGAATNRLDEFTIEYVPPSI